MKGWCLFRRKSGLSVSSSCGSIFIFAVFYYISVFLSLYIQRLAFERAFTEGDSVSMWLPILSSSPSQHPQNSSLCLGISPVAASPSGEVDADGGGCCWSLHRQMHYQHQGCEKHSGIFSDHEWSHLWFFSGSKCVEGPGAAHSSLAQEWLTGQYSSLLQHPGLFLDSSQPWFCLVCVWGTQIRTHHVLQDSALLLQAFLWASSSCCCFFFFCSVDGSSFMELP